MLFDGDIRKLGGYLRELADLMGLRDWRLAIGSGRPKDTGDSANIECVYGRRVAVLSFPEDWASAEPEEFRQTCVHELLHCHFDAVMWPINGVANQVGEMVYRPLYDAVHDRIESGVDATAEAWAKMLPLPEASKREKKS